MLYINDDFYSEQALQQRIQPLLNALPLDLTAKPRLAVCVDDIALWLAFCFYCQKHRLSVMPIAVNTPQQRAEQLAQKAGCQFLLFNDAFVPVAPPADTTDSTTKADDGEHCHYGLIQMSSGTTGEPKVIERAWPSIEQEIQSYLAAFTLPNRMTPIVACPVTHSYGLICGVMMAIARGKQPHIITNINPKYLIKKLFHLQDHLLYASPTLLDGLIRLWPKGRKLHAVMTSGTVMSEKTFHHLKGAITHLFQQYGCSEAGCIAINQDMSSPGNMGNPLPHLNLQVSLEPTRPSEIVVQVQPLSPSEDHKTVHTSDMGYATHNDDGTLSLHYLSRLDDTILVAGLNVYPQDVENTVLILPGITDAVAFKIEDSLAGQRVCLYYTAAESLSEQTVRQWCLDHLAPFQVPHYYRQVNQIERMPNGKINRINLARDFQNHKKVSAVLAD